MINDYNLIQLTYYGIISGNKVLTPSDASDLDLILLPNSQGHPNSILFFNGLKEIHRQLYTCRVENKLYSDESSIYIRTRRKFKDI